MGIDKIKKIIHHNYYFISWLIVTKNVKIEKTKNKKGFFILGLSKETYDEYKEEYRVKHKNILTKINNKVSDLKKDYRSN